MAEFQVPTERGKVSVRLDSIPKDPAERDRLIDEKLARGEYRPLPVAPSTLFPDPAEQGMAAGARAGTMGPAGANNLLTTAKRAAPAVAGGIGGAVVGSLVGGPPGAVIGGSLGSAGGEAITQYMDPFKTGIEPDWRAIPMAGAVPGAAKGTIGLAGRTMASLPGVAAGRQQALQHTLGPQGSGLMREFPPSAPLWRQVEQQAQGMAVPVPTGRLSLLSQEIRTAGQGDVFGGAKLNRLATQLEKLSGGETGVQYVPLLKLRQNMSSLGAEIAAQEKVKGGGAALGQMKRAYRAMWEEMDDAVRLAEKNGNPVASTLRQAVDSHKRELAEAEIGKIYNSAMSYSSGQRQVDPNAMLKQLDVKDSMLSRWLPKDELQEIKDILVDYGKVPKIPSQNEPVGNLSRLASAMGPDQFAAVMSSRPGRRMVRMLVENEGVITHGITAPLMQMGGRMGLNETMYPPQGTPQ